MSKYGIMSLDERDQQMIQTPWGKKRWRTIRLAFEQRDELLAACKEMLSQWEREARATPTALTGVPEAAELHRDSIMARRSARVAIAKAEGSQS